MNSRRRQQLKIKELLNLIGNIKAILRKGINKAQKEILRLKRLEHYILKNPHKDFWTYETSLRYSLEMLKQLSKNNNLENS